MWKGQERWEEGSLKRTECGMDKKTHRFCVWRGKVKMHFRVFMIIQTGFWNNTTTQTNTDPYKAPFGANGGNSAALCFCQIKRDVPLPYIHHPLAEKPAI